MSKRAAATDVNEMDGVAQCKLAKTRNKASILENEANAMSLAKTKVVYSRRGEEKDTLVVRDLFPRARFDRFGIKGIDQLKRIFYIILGTASEHRTTLLKRMRYGGDAFRSLLDGLSNDDREGMRTALDDVDNSITPSMKITLKNLETYPQLELLQYDADGTLANGIYLYVGEAVKLVKHMNSVFAFSKSDCLSFVKAAPIKKYTDDNFF